MSDENRYFDDLLVLCGEINFSTLAIWIFHISGGLEILMGVMAVVSSAGRNPADNKKAQTGSKVVLNPGPGLVIGACDALFVMGPSRDVVTETLKTVLEMFLLGEELPFMHGHEYPQSPSFTSRERPGVLDFGGEWAAVMQEEQKGEAFFTFSS